MSNQPIDPRLKKFQEAKRAKRELKERHKTAEAVCNGAKDIFLETRGFIVSRETLVKNVINWRQCAKLPVDSVILSELATLDEAQRRWPRIKDLNTACNMLKWRKQMVRRAEKQQLEK